MSCRLVVEARHLAISAASVERDPLLERPVGFQTHPLHTRRDRMLLELRQQPPPKSQSASVTRHPHPLQLGGRSPVGLEGAAPDPPAAKALRSQCSCPRLPPTIIGLAAPPTGSRRLPALSPTYPDVL